MIAVRQTREAPGRQWGFAVSLTDGEVHCAAMGGLAGRFVENKWHKYEI